MSIIEILKKHNVENAELENELTGYIGKLSDNSDTIPYSQFKEKVSEVNTLKERLATLEAETEANKTKMESFKETETKLNQYESELKNYRDKEFAVKKESFKKYHEFLTAKEDNPKFQESQKFREVFTDVPENFDDLTIEHLEKYQPFIKAIDVAGVLEEKEINKQRPSHNNGNNNQIDYEGMSNYERMLLMQKTLSKK